QSIPSVYFSAERTAQCGENGTGAGGMMMLSALILVLIFLAGRLVLTQTIILRVCIKPYQLMHASIIHKNRGLPDV
ncbi:MAG: hypothetical protein R6T87_11205, partial [Marinobacter sp.]